MNKEILISAIQNHIKDFNGQEVKAFYETKLGFTDVFTEEDNYMDYFKSDEYLERHITDGNIEKISNIVAKKIDCQHYLISDSFKELLSNYIKTLPNRIQEDLNSNDYDSVITKSRTLIEETCIYIINDETISKSKKGDVGRLYDECKNRLGFPIQSPNDYEKQLNGVFNGLKNATDAIANLRNNFSDAHGNVNNNRPKIEKRYAILIANAAISLSEFLLEAYYDRIQSGALPARI